MNDTLRVRIRRWFKRSGGPVHMSTGTSGASGSPDGNGVPALRDARHANFEPVRGSFFRPWKKRDAAIANLQHGFNTLTDLMVAVRDNLEQQNRRQDELIGYLSHLPEALHAIPETNRAQSETLKAIHQQMAYQSQQQNRVGNILEKIGDSSTEQGKILHALSERAEMLEHHDQMISENLSSVGIAMQSVSRNTDSSTKVLKTLGDQLDARDGEIQKVLQQQTKRVTMMLTLAICLSIVALIAVAVMAFVMFNPPQQQRQRDLPVASGAATQPAVEVISPPAITPAATQPQTISGPTLAIPATAETDENP